MDAAQLAATLDSTNLRLDTTEADLAALYTETAAQHFACVMLYPANVAFAARESAGTGLRIGTVIGFPSGGIRTLADARTLLAAGATRLGTSNAGAILAELRGAAATGGAGY